MRSHLLQLASSWHHPPTTVGGCLTPVAHQCMQGRQAGGKSQLSRCAGKGKRQLACHAGALAHVLRLAEVSQQALTTLSAISQFGYAWGLLEPHIPRLQALVSSLMPSALLLGAHVAVCLVAHVLCCAIAYLRL